MKKLKKAVCLCLALMLVFTPSTSAFAKNNKKDKQNNSNKIELHNNKKVKAQKKKFKLNDKSVIKFGKYKLPINPVTKGMGAKLDYKNKGNILKVEKGYITIKIDFKNETVYINGVKDKSSNIFRQKNKNNTIVLIQYIAEILGIKIDCKKDEVIVEKPGLDHPTNIKITPIGTVVQKNTLNSTTTEMVVTASIKAGQATGGKAELYVDNRLVAIDNEIKATDKTVTFTTSDGTPTNEELRALVPTGGVVSVRLYNAEGKYVISNSNPSLTVDYVVPTIASITSGSLDLSKGQLILKVTGAGAVGDKVDVTKLIIYNTQLGSSYRLTNDNKTGSRGEVKADNLLVIDLGSKDKRGLTGFNGNNLYLMVAQGALLYDNAGNKSSNFTSDFMVPLNGGGTLGFDAPTNVKVTVYGANTKENTLNTTTTHITVTANIVPGQATGGKAELYVGDKLVATDTIINSTDNIVSFTTSDGTPTNDELKALIPSGGTVSVRLYNANGYYVVSTVGNPTLVVDYVAPTLTSVVSATYNPLTKQIYFDVTGASAEGDFIDVTKISIFDSNLQKSYTLTNNANTGSTGVVKSSSSLLIQIGSLDQVGLSGFGVTSMFLTIKEGALLQDKAGNTSTNMATQVLPLNIVR